MVSDCFPSGDTCVRLPAYPIKKIKVNSPKVSNACKIENVFTMESGFRKRIISFALIIICVLARRYGKSLRFYLNIILMSYLIITVECKWTA